MTIYEVIRAIQQAAADASDHPYGTEDTGALQREKGDPITDSRVIDGFGTKIVGNKLIVTYSTPTKTSTVHNTKFENDMERRVADLVKYLKKKFKEDTGSTLKLKKEGDIYVRFEAVSYVRSYAIATCVYEIGNYDKFESGTEGEAQERYDKIDRMLDEGYKPELAWKKWQQSSDTPKKKLNEDRDQISWDSVKVGDYITFSEYYESPNDMTPEQYITRTGQVRSLGWDPSTPYPTDEDIAKVMLKDGRVKSINRGDENIKLISIDRKKLNEGKDHINYDNGYTLSVIYDGGEFYEVAVLNPSGRLLRLGPHDEVVNVKMNKMSKLDSYLRKGGTNLADMRKLLGTNQ